MIESFGSAAYVLASLLFIMSLRGLSTPELARRGNRFGAIGMLLAVLATIAVVYSGRAAFRPDGATNALLVGALVAGAALGVLVAARVAMTAMPELVAMLHSFVGLAAVLVGLATELDAHGRGAATGVVHGIEVFAGVFVGAVTFTGSVVAFLKLRGTLRSRPLLLPGRHWLTAAAVLAAAGLTAAGIRAGEAHDFAAAEAALFAATAVAALLGIHLVIGVGGGDMPVVVSLLNSYSGWAAAVTGFLLANDLLIITGALVGSSGAILSYIMCRAMHRSIWSVLFGGFGAEPAGARAAGAAVAAGTVRSTSPAEVAQLLAAAQRVVVVPGYGLAVAQAQHTVVEITSVLAARGIAVCFAIHPVAGRLPGHMNVLLAEAGAPYEAVKDMDEVRDLLPAADVVMVIGANDVVNPSALDDPSSPIYRMPVLEVWRAARVVMLKRGMAAGYAGVDNPLCYRENTLMLFGDAKQSATRLLDALHRLFDFEARPAPAAPVQSATLTTER